MLFDSEFLSRKRPWRSLKSMTSFLGVNTNACSFEGQTAGTRTSLPACQGSVSFL